MGDLQRSLFIFFASPLLSHCVLCHIFSIPSLRLFDDDALCSGAFSFFGCRGFQGGAIRFPATNVHAVHSCPLYFTVLLTICSTRAFLTNPLYSWAGNVNSSNLDNAFNERISADLVSVPAPRHLLCVSMNALSPEKGSERTKEGCRGGLIPGFTHAVEHRMHRRVVMHWYICATAHFD